MYVNLTSKLSFIAQRQTIYCQQNYNINICLIVYLITYWIMELYNNIYILNRVSVCPLQSSVRHSIKTNNPSPQCCRSLLHFCACCEFIFICCKFCYKFPVLFHLLFVIFNLFLSKDHFQSIYLLAILSPLAILAVVRQFGKILKFLFFVSDLSVELLRCELKVLH